MNRLNAFRMNPSWHLAMVLLAAIALLLPVYYLEGLSAWKPSRAIGPLVQFKTQKTQSLTNLSGSENLTSEVQNIAKDRSRDVAKNTAIDTADQQIKKSGDESSPQAPKEAAVASTVAAKPSKNAIDGEENLASYFQALKNTSDGRVAKAIHYGDSTIAGDSIAKTVRARLQKKFGDGGPGFFVTGMDPRWMRRDDVRISRTGDWDINTILFGGNQGRYGIGGVVAKPKGVNATILITGAKPGSTLGQHVELYTRIPKKEDPIQFEINGVAVSEIKRKDFSTFTTWIVDHPEAVKTLKIKVTESGLETYGAVIEKTQGATWETTAVVGVSSKSFEELNATHIGEQTSHRHPDLVVLMIGGNEAGHGGIFSPGGKIYKDTFGAALRKVRQGSPKSACLVVSPLDQGEQSDDGNVTSKKSIGRMVALQREVALEQGCGFWNSWRFMGGENSFAKWLNQGLAWTDLAHFTERGLQTIGNGLSDALLESYQRYESNH
jgi:lysophospholipase L1-like esterase